MASKTAALKGNMQNAQPAQGAAKAPLVKGELAINTLLKEKMQSQIAMALPAHLKNNAPRYARIAITLIRSNPTLADCSATSLIGAIMTGTQLGLDPTPALGQYAIVPFKGVATFVLEYQGMIDLAHRSGRIKTIYAKEVYERDFFEYSFGLEPRLEHKPCGLADPGPVKHVYSVCLLTNGGVAFEIMSWEQVLEHGKRYSKSFHKSDSPWQTNPVSMAKKTLVRQLFKYLPKGVEIAMALAQDGTVHEELPKGPESEILDAPYVYVGEGEAEISETEQPAAIEQKPEPETIPMPGTAQPEMEKIQEKSTAKPVEKSTSAGLPF